MLTRELKNHAHAHAVAQNIGFFDIKKIEHGFQIAGARFDTHGIEIFGDFGIAVAAIIKPDASVVPAKVIDLIGPM
jgi:hypothetical protein